MKITTQKIQNEIGEEPQQIIVQRSLSDQHQLQRRQQDQKNYQEKQIKDQVRLQHLNSNQNEELISSEETKIQQSALNNSIHNGEESYISTNKIDYKINQQTQQQMNLQKSRIIQQQKQNMPQQLYSSQHQMLIISEKQGSQDMNDSRNSQISPDFKQKQKLIKDENIIFLFIQLTYYYGPLLFFAMCIPYSVIQFNQYLILNSEKESKSSKQVLQEIIQDINTSPINEIQIIDVNQNDILPVECAYQFQPLKLATWPGSPGGCYCPHQKQEFIIDKYLCNQNQNNCTTVHSINPQPIYSWKNKQICVKRHEKWLRAYKRRCPSNMILCNNLCFQKNEQIKECPITKINYVGKKTKNIITQQNDSSTQFITVSRTPDIRYQPIINIRAILNARNSCINTNLNPTNQVSKIRYGSNKKYSEYTLSANKGCGDYGNKNKYQRTIDSMPELQLLKENQLAGLSATLPKYQHFLESYGITSHLVQESSIEINSNSQVCIKLTSDGSEGLKELYMNVLPFENFSWYFLAGFPLSAMLFSILGGFVAFNFLYQEQFRLLQIPIDLRIIVNSVLIQCLIFIFQKIYFVVFIDEQILTQLRNKLLLLHNECFSDQSVLLVINNILYQINQGLFQEGYYVNFLYCASLCYIMLLIICYIIHKCIFNLDYIEKPIKIDISNY